MQSSRCCAIWVAFLVTTALVPVQTEAADKSTTESTIAVGGGAAWVSGDGAAFQQHTQHSKDGFGGIEDYRYTREFKDNVFKLEGRLMYGEGDYGLKFRWDKEEKFYLTTGYEQFRVFYDGSGGFFRPTGTVFKLYPEDLSVDRGKLWFEFGTVDVERPLVKFRYERQTRKGSKGSTHWGDTNLVGAPYGTRNIVPTLYDLDEVRHLFTLDVSKETDVQSWAVGGRYEYSELDNKRFTRRRPFESADRSVTTKDQTTTDIFAAHGFYERKLKEEVRVTAGGLVTTLDTNLMGSRIYGAGRDPVYDPTYASRQARDEGYYQLHGGAQYKQYVANLNVVYVPAKNWTIRPSVKFEDLRQDTISMFEETNVATNLSPIVEEVDGEHSKSWDEFTEAIEVRYTRNNWVLSAEGEWNQGMGEVQEDRLLVETGAFTIDRDSEYERIGQKYTLSANWYAKPGLTFAGQYYYKVKVNDYDATRDSTPAGSADRYPAYITDQDFETHDFNFRMSWRPRPLLSFVTRYDYQTSTITSVEAGLAKAESSELNTHIVSQNATWNPTARLYVSGNINVTWDQLKTPAYAFVQQGDNNYINGALGAGYAIGKVTDVYLDYTFYRADNFIDNSATSLPFGADQRQQAAYLTWVRRHTANLIYTVKYGFVTNRDGTYVGRNDYDGHMIYGKVQYRY